MAKSNPWSREVINRNLSGSADKSVEKIKVTQEEQPKVVDDHLASISEQRCSLTLEYLERNRRLPKGVTLVQESDFEGTIYWPFDTLTIELTVKIKPKSSE